MKKIILTLGVIILAQFNLVSADSNYSCSEKEINSYDFDYDNGNLNIVDINNNKYSINYSENYFDSFDPYDIPEEYKDIASFDYKNKKLTYNGKEVNTYNLYGGWEDTPIQVYLSQDKKSFSFKASDDTGYFVMKDGVKQQTYFSFPSTTFVSYSPKENSNFIIYYGVDKNDNYIINLNGLELSNYKYPEAYGLGYFDNGNSAFSLNGKDGKKYVITCDLSKTIEVNTTKSETQTINKETKKTEAVLNNIPLKTTTYTLTTKEKSAIKIIANKINAMSTTKRSIYIKKLNIYLTKFQEGSRSYEIVYNLLDDVNSYESVRGLFESISY